MLEGVTHGAPFAALRQWRQFIVVLYVPRADGKTDKFPIDPTTGKVADAHNPAIWMDADNAARLAGLYGPGYGIGFVFTARDPFFFIDIDGAATPNGWSEFSQWMLARFPGACVEVSQSGQGLHIIGSYANVPAAHGKKNIQYHCEYYTELRFVALTGNHAYGDAGTRHDAALAGITQALFQPKTDPAILAEWTSAPVPEWRGPVNDEDLLRRALQSRSAGSEFGNKASFSDLWYANADALGRVWPHPWKPYDASSADMALAMHLMFWTGRDCARVERLMMLSALKRDKWEDRGEYYLRDMTITNAYRMNSQVCQDKPLEPPPALAQPSPLAGAAPALLQPLMSAVTGNMFAGSQDQERLFGGCVYIADMHRVLVPGGKLYKPEQFRAFFGGYTFMMDAANQRISRSAFEAFTESQVLRCPRADSVCFQPRMAPAIIIDRGGQKWANTYWPVHMPRKQGDVTPFLEHVKKLAPVEHDRMILTSYLAAMVQYKGSKFQWAPIIQGMPGNGKTLISVCIAEALGQRYIHWPKASKLSKEFNGWMLNKLAYLVEDIYTPARREEEILEDLKPMITGGKGLEIESKGVDQISADICGNFLFNMNKQNGIKKARIDRRYSFFLTPQQSLEDLKRDGMTGDYHIKLQTWLERGEGYAIVHDYLATFDIPKEYNPALDMGGWADRAPLTSTTPQAIKNSAGRVEQEIAEAIAQGKPGFARGWVSYHMLSALLASEKRITVHARREMLSDMGYVRHPGLHDGRTHRAVLPDGMRSQLWLVEGHPAMQLRDAEAIANAYEADNK